MFTGPRTKQNQLAQLNATIGQCDTCALHTRKGLGYGNPNASVLLLGQNTGVRIQGSNPEKVPFGLHEPDPSGVGKSADVLRAILWECGIRPGDYYVTNIMKCQVKKPERYMLENCRMWLNEELAALTAVRLIVALGSMAGSAIGAQTGHLSLFKVDPGDLAFKDKLYFVTRVSHPAFVLYPGGITRDDYREQWRFVRAVISRLHYEPTTRILGR